MLNRLNSNELPQTSMKCCSLSDQPLKVRSRRLTRNNGMREILRRAFEPQNIIRVQERKKLLFSFQVWLKMTGCHLPFILYITFNSNQESMSTTWAVPMNNMSNLNLSFSAGKRRLLKHRAEEFMGYHGLMNHNRKTKINQLIPKPKS